MSTYQYRVVPAPTKGLKAKGIKAGEGRFANALEDLMNTMGAEGWEYQRAETLPSTERAGLTGSSTEWRNVLVFRKPRETIESPVDSPLVIIPELDIPEPLQDPFEEAEIAQHEVEDPFDEKTILDLGNGTETKT